MQKEVYSLLELDLVALETWSWKRHSNIWHIVTFIKLVMKVIIDSDAYTIYNIYYKALKLAKLIRTKVAQLN